MGHFIKFLPIAGQRNGVFCYLYLSLHPLRIRIGIAPDIKKNVVYFGFFQLADKWFLLFKINDKQKGNPLLPPTI